MARAPIRRGDLRIPGMAGAVALTPPGGLPAGNPAAGFGQATNSIMARVERLEASLNQRADQVAEEAAWEAGTVAGEADPGVQMGGGGRIARTAYNRAAADAGARRLDVLSRTELNRLAETAPTDPAAFNAGATEWRDRIAAGLPARMQGVFRDRFDVAALPISRQISEQQRRHVADQALATFNEALPGRLAGIERAAAQATTDPAAARALAAEEDQLVAEAIALGPREAFTLGGRQYPADPSRGAALSVAQLEQRVAGVRRERSEALVIGAWRAAGGRPEWIDEFERGQVMPRVQGWIGQQAAAGTARRPVERLIGSVPQAWRPIAEQAAAENGIAPPLLLALLGQESGGRADAVSPAGAIGPAQIMPATARDPGFGMAPLPADALTDPARAIPWAAQYLARIRDSFGGDIARALAAYNAGPRRVREAEAAGRALPQETRDYLAALLPAAGAALSGGLPADEVRPIVARLRAELARDEARTREQRTTARAEAQRLIDENMQAIGVSGAPVHRLDLDLLTRAGLDPVEVTQRETVARGRYSAAEMARGASDPAELQRIAEAFRPGTPGFAADPRAAAELLRFIEGRGVQVQGAAMAEELRDREAEVQAGRPVRPVTAEEGRAAGLRPEQVAEVNAGLAQQARLAALRREAEAAPPAERDALLARLPVQGGQARENAEGARVVLDAFQARDRAVAQDAAAYALAGTEEGRRLATAVGGGDLAALPRLVAVLAAQQDAMGIPEAQRRALPRPISDALFARIADAVDADGAEAALRALTEAAGPAGVARIAADVSLPGQATGDRRQAIVVAAALAGRQDDTSRLILRGAFVLRDNPLPDARAADMERALDGEIGAALARRPDVRSQVLAAARAIYAAGSADRGALTGAFDRGRFREAVNRVAPSTWWGGEAVLLPPSMDEARFRAVMAALPPDRMTGAIAGDGSPITPAMVARGGFSAETVGPGRYLLRYGAQEVLDAAGGRRPFVLDLNGAQPVEAGPVGPGAGRSRDPADAALEAERFRARAGERLRPVDGP
jgi:soluble lytic murein transglycosylase-like protein